MSLVSIVTAPFRAIARPSMSTPVVAVTDASAMIVPAKSEFVPRVAELPICQNTLHDCAPSTRDTTLADAVVNVDPTWKTQTAFGSPSASRVSVPDNRIEDEAL
jgi:hypothetical protein